MTKRIVVGWAVVLVVGVVVVFGRSYWHPFVNFDDPYYVTNNGVVQGGLSGEGVVYAFTMFDLANWHPLTWLSHMADVSLFGVNAGAHRAVNVGLHGLNAVLVLLGLTWLTGRVWPSALVALLFAVHPLRVESVVWVSERKDVLSTLFFLLAIGAYAAWAKKGGAVRYVLLVALFALGLLAKPMIVTLPCVLLLLDVWPLKRVDLAKGIDWTAARARVVEKLPLFAMALASGIVTIVAQRSGGATQTLSDIPLWARAANASNAYWEYLWLTVWPSGLALVYPHPGTDVSIPLAVVGAVALVAVTAWAILLRGRAPYALAGWLVYVGMMLPVIGLLQVGDQAMADRYTYVPVIGVAMAVVFGMADAVTARPQLAKGLMAACVALCVVYGGTAYRQVGHWRSSVALFEHALAVTDRNAPAHTYLGMAYQSEQRISDAAEQYLSAVSIDPDVFAAHFNLGHILLAATRYDVAFDHFSEAARIRPEREEPWLQLGVIETARGNLLNAVDYFRTARERNPENPFPVVKLAELSERQGAPEMALALYREAHALGADAPAIADAVTRLESAVAN